MSDYNIHIHLPGEGGTVNGKPVQEAPQANKVTQWFDHLVSRVKHCYDWKSLHAMKEEFAKIGLTLHETSGGRKVLCRIEEGKPVINNIVDDYIFVGSNELLDEEISPRALEVIVYFLENRAGSPQAVMDSSQLYSKNMALYGKPLKIYGENSQVKNQEIATLGGIIDQNEDDADDIIYNQKSGNGPIDYVAMQQLRFPRTNYE